jgi:pyruvate,orthophosphate dikinase
VVAGIRTPRPLREMEQDLPNAYRQFLETAQRLERENQDMQDVEFTVERDTLYMLQTRSGKRTGVAVSRSRGPWLRRV